MRRLKLALPDRLRYSVQTWWPSPPGRRCRNHPRVSAMALDQVVDEPPVVAVDVALLRLYALCERGHQPRSLNSRRRSSAISALFVVRSSLQSKRQTSEG